MSTERLEADLVAHAAAESAGLVRALALLREFDRRQGWAAWECRSAAQWMSWKCGLSLSAGIERVRVAHALAGLPLVEAAFVAGVLSYSKVRAVTRVATATDEATWVAIGEHATAAQIDRLASAFKRVTRQQALDQITEMGLWWSTQDDGSVEFTLRLPAEAAMTVIESVRAETVLEKHTKNSHVAAKAAVRLLTGGMTASVIEVVVHLHDDQAFVEGGSAVHPDLAACLACDGPVTTVTDTPAGPVVKEKRTAPTKRQRKWLAARHPQCQFPGCHHTGAFEVHHVVERQHGGRTRVRNLSRLCWFHHRMVHLHRLVLTLHADRRLEVQRPDGTPIDKVVPHREWSIAPIDDPSRIGGTWYGDKLSIPDCFDALGIRWATLSCGKPKQPVSAPHAAEAVSRVG